MREIKFRAWHDEWKEMVYSNTWNEDSFQKRSFYPFCFDIGFSHYPQNSDWKIMQSTGLKDKNGKEIYEGDILMGELPFENTERMPIIEIYWDNSRGGYELKYLNSTIHPPINWVSGYKIIGNVYQKPNELLAKNNCA